MGEAEYGLLISFTDQSESFVNGYEAALIAAQMEHGPRSEFERVVHAENVDVLHRIANAYEWHISFSDTMPLSDGWQQMTAEPWKKKPNLRVVNDV